MGSERVVAFCLKLDGTWSGGERVAGKSWVMSGISTECEQVVRKNIIFANIVVSGSLPAAIKLVHITAQLMID